MGKNVNGRTENTPNPLVIVMYRQLAKSKTKITEKDSKTDLVNFTFFNNSSSVSSEGGLMLFDFIV